MKANILSTMILTGAFLSPAFLNHVSFKTIPRDNTDSSRLVISAKDSTIKDDQHHIIKLYGQARIKYNSSVVGADYIEISELDQSGIAVGHVVMEHVADQRRISSTKIAFKLE